jgi:hypothetical protein
MSEKGRDRPIALASGRSVLWPTAVENVAG